MTAPHKGKDTAQTQRILLVDDHPLVRTGLARLIDDEPDLEVCAEAADTGEALQRIEDCRPDLAIIDISLKEGSGLELIKRIRGHNARIRLLVLSMHDESLYAERALRAGAMGYVNKQEASARVVEAIRKVLAGKIYLSERMTERALQALADGAAERDQPLSQLSDRELEVFSMIGQGVGTSDIAARLHLSVKTIESHRNKIKQKLGLGGATELNRYAMRWVMDHAPPS